MDGQALDAAEARRELEQLEPLDRPAAASQPAAELEAEHAAEAGHLASGDGVRRVAGASRGSARPRPRDAGAGARRRARRWRCAARRAGASVRIPRVHEPGVERAQHRADVQRHVPDRLDQRRPVPPTTPAEVSECPARYFVALCQTRSTPSSIGRWLTGVANVLSASVTMPRARARSRRPRAMSVISSRGLLGDSIRNSRVAGVIGSAQASDVRLIDEGALDPEARQELLHEAQRAAVHAALRHHVIAARTSASTAVVSAPMPEPKTRPARRPRASRPRRPARRGSGCRGACRSPASRPRSPTRERSAADGERERRRLKDRRGDRPSDARPRAACGWLP